MHSLLQVNLVCKIYLMKVFLKKDCFLWDKIILEQGYKTIIYINLVLHRKNNMFQNLIATKINKTKYNSNGKQGHLPICFLNSAYREMKL